MNIRPFDAPTFKIPANYDQNQEINVLRAPRDGFLKLGASDCNTQLDIAICVSKNIEIEIICFFCIAVNKPPADY